MALGGELRVLDTLGTALHHQAVSLLYFLFLDDLNKWPSWPCTCCVAFHIEKGGVLYCFDYFLSLFLDTEYKLSYGKGGAGEVLSLHVFLGSHLTETSER